MYVVTCGTSQHAYKSCCQYINKYNTPCTHHKVHVYANIHTHTQVDQAVHPATPPLLVCRTIWIQRVAALTSLQVATGYMHMLRIQLACTILSSKAWPGSALLLKIVCCPPLLPSTHTQVLHIKQLQWCSNLLPKWSSSSNEKGSTGLVRGGTTLYRTWSHNNQEILLSGRACKWKVGLYLVCDRMCFLQSGYAYYHSGIFQQFFGST